MHQPNIRVTHIPLKSTSSILYFFSGRQTFEWRSFRHITMKYQGQTISGFTRCFHVCTFCLLIIIFCMKIWKCVRTDVNGYLSKALWNINNNDKNAWKPICLSVIKSLFTMKPNNISYLELRIFLTSSNYCNYVSC